jgi:hypothetical protein
MGAIVSYLQSRGVAPAAANGMPPYVSLMYEPPGLYDNEASLYTGNANRPFAPRDEGIENLRLAQGISLDRFQNRRGLLERFDALQRRVDRAGTTAPDANVTDDEFRRRAFEMIVSPKVRDAFDLSQEKDATRERYGKYCENLLMARRLVEAGVSVVTLKLGDWDTHEKNFRDMRDQCPQLDQGVHTLVTELYDR